MSVLTDDTISKQNHPLFYVDEQNKTQDVMTQYHFNLDASFSAIGQLTKDIILDSWDHPKIELDELDYLNDLDDHTSIYFIVLSKDSAQAEIAHEKEDTHVTDDIPVTGEQNDEDKLEKVKKPTSSKGARSNTRASKSNKKNVSAYFLCIPPICRIHISEDNFCTNMKRVNKALRRVSNDRVIKTDKVASYSMLSALSDGFNVVLYSRTHKYIPKVLHKSLGVRIIVGKGMNLLFNGHLIHGGGKSRINEEGVLSEDMRIFYYIWNTSNRC